MPDTRVRMLGIAAAIVAVAFCGPRAESQKNTTKVGAGMVSGQVSCADTNAPARFAVVTLEPMPGTRVKTNAVAGADGQSNATAMTDLDGRFALDNVPVGRYFVLGSLAGYVNPLARFDASQLQEMSEATVKELSKLVPVVTIEAGTDATVTLRLEHASEVGGTVLYDDGSPAVGLQVELLRKEASGELAQVRSEMIDGLGEFGSHATTDDRGHYRMIGTPPGEYTVHLTMPLQQVSVSGLLGGSGSSISVKGDEGGRLSLYTGNKFRKKDAVFTKVGEGETVGGLDFTIPVVGLHSVNGAVTTLSDGRGVNGGQVELLYADDREVAKTTRLGEDGEFQFVFVPEGNYVLRMAGAENAEESRDRVYATNPAAGDPTSDPSSPGAEMPVVVDGDVSGVSLVVKQAPVKTVAAQP